MLCAGVGLGQIGRDDEIVVGDQPDGGDDPIVTADDQAQPLEARDADRGEDAVGDVDRFAGKQDEDPDQAREGARVSSSLRRCGAKSAGRDSTSRSVPSRAWIAGPV